MSIVFPFLPENIGRINDLLDLAFLSSINKEITMLFFPYFDNRNELLLFELKNQKHSNNEGYGMNFFE